MHKRCWIVASVLICSAVVSLAQTPDAPATREDILKLFDTMKIHDQMRLVMDSVLKQQRAMIHEAIRRHQPNVSEDELKHLDQFMTDIMKDMPVNELLDDMIPVYQKHLSKSDVEAMIGFYSTPTGQKILREMPAMTKDGIQAMQPRLRQMMDDANAKIEKMVKEQKGNKDK